MSTKAAVAIGKAFATRARALILQVLVDGGRSVGEVANVTGLSLAAASHHVGVLAGLGVVRKEQDGRETWVRVAPEYAAVVAKVVELSDERGDDDDAEEESGGE
jgi:DNA-binding transcriptional ArsR family regulator